MKIKHLLNKAEIEEARSYLHRLAAKFEAGLIDANISQPMRMKAIEKYNAILERIASGKE